MRAVPLGEKLRLLASCGAFASSDELLVDETNPIQDVTFKFAEGVPMHVTVRDANGVPVPAAFVSIYPQCHVAGIDLSFGWQMTDAQGQVTFEHVNPDLPWSYVLSVQPMDTLAGVKMPVKIDGNPVTVILSRGLVLKGRVVNGKTGEPLDEAQVAAVPRGDNAAGRPTAYIASEGDGGFCFRDLSPGQYSLEVRNAAPAEAIVTTRPDGMDVQPPGWPTFFTAGQDGEVLLRVQALPLPRYP
jgi:hypothetical protein